MNPINSTASSARENRVKERNQKRSALQDVTNSKQQNNTKRAKDTVDPPIENGSSANSANDNEHNNVQNSVLLPNLTHVMNGTNSESSNIKEWLRQLVVAQVSELSKPQLNSTVGTNDPIIHENNNQTKESPSMSIFGNLAVGGNSNPENQDKSLALHDDESLVHSAMAASSSGPNQHENDMQSDINLPTFLGRVTKVKREDAKYGIVHRFYVKLCQFDFCGAANSPLNSTKYSKFNALNTFKTWADAAETSNYSLALMISNTTDLARNYSAVITDSEEVPPFFDTTQLHGFCAVAFLNL